MDQKNRYSTLWLSQGGFISAINSARTSINLKIAEIAVELMNPSISLSAASSQPALLQFRSANNKSDFLIVKPLNQSAAYAMISYRGIINLPITRDQTLLSRLLVSPILNFVSHFVFALFFCCFPSCTEPHSPRHPQSFLSCLWAENGFVFRIFSKLNDEKSIK